MWLPGGWSCKARAIGVSNFRKTYLKDLIKHANIMPAADQIEFHPLLQEYATIDFEGAGRPQNFAHYALGQKRFSAPYEFLSEYQA